MEVQVTEVAVCRLDCGATEWLLRMEVQVTEVAVCRLDCGATEWLLLMEVQVTEVAVCRLDFEQLNGIVSHSVENRQQWRQV
jgi:hypothetical protein